MWSDRKVLIIKVIEIKNKTKKNKQLLLSGKINILNWVFFQGPVKIGKLLNHHLNLNQLKSELPPARREKHFSRDVLKNRKKRRPKIWWKHLKYCLVLILRKLKMNSRGYIKKWWETLIRYLRMNKTISYCCSSNWRKLFIWWKYNVFYSYLIFVFKFFPEIKDMGFLIFLEMIWRWTLIETIYITSEQKRECKHCKTKYLKYLGQNNSKQK